MRPEQEVLDRLAQHTVRKAEAGEIGARELAGVAYGAACCARAVLPGLLFTVLARAAEWRLIEFNE